MRRRTIASVMAFTVTAMIGTGGVARAQKDVKFYPATITFTNAPTSSSLPGEVRLRDDGEGLTYTGATIVTADSANLNIDLSRSARRFRVTLKDGSVGPGGPLPAGTGPGQAGVTYVTGTQLNVYGVRTVVVGASAVREMGVTVDEIKRGYRLRFKPNAEGIGTSVCVTRWTLTTWTVSSLAANDACGGDTSGGETTRLIDQSKSGSPLIGTYLMPFSFDVSCPTCQ